MQKNLLVDSRRVGLTSTAQVWEGQIRRNLRRPQFWFGATVLVPTILWYWFFAYHPIYAAIRMSVVRYNLLLPETSPFVGLDNFRQLLANGVFVVSVRNTFTWALLMVTSMIPISLGVSLLLVAVWRGRNFYQAFVFLPVVMSLVAVGLLFRMLMDPQVGQFNAILESLGLPGYTWLSSTDSALVTMVGVNVWKGLGFYVVILTAGMLNIPMELHDAATVDGVNSWQRLRYLTMPLISNALALVMVVLVIGAMQEFTSAFVLTNGGPGQATYMFNMLIWEEAFTNLRFGTATAGALMQFGVILIITFVQLRLIRPAWSY